MVFKAYFSEYQDLVSTLCMFAAFTQDGNYQYSVINTYRPWKMYYQSDYIGVVAVIGMPNPNTTSSIQSISAVCYPIFHLHTFMVSRTSGPYFTKVKIILKSGFKDELVFLGLGKFVKILSSS